MCDTFVALKQATRDGSVIFGKNSDRYPNEAQELVMIPRSTHPDDALVTCTYISVPQVKETNAVLLSRPFWIWGAEMGANEQGVVIGNEAVFTKEPYDKDPGLLGMDILRLALERSSSAREALDVMIKLLETHGQGGNCMYGKSFYYHNGFLIADPEEAWVFETAGKHWAAEKVRNFRSISNIISIGSTYDLASDDLVSNAIKKGWCKDPEAFNFSECYSNLIYTRFGVGEHRSCRIMDLLGEKIGKIDLAYAMDILRDHGPEADEDWLPGKGLVGAEVCMHASFGPVRESRTTGSMISHLTTKEQMHWFTGTASPCTSVFKPVWFDGGLPDLGPAPEGVYDEATYWWRHENLHRELLRDYATRISIVSEANQTLENEFITQAREINQAPQQKKREFTRRCFEIADQNTAELIDEIIDMPVHNMRPLLDRIAWRKFDKEARRSR